MIVNGQRVLAESFTPTTAARAALTAKGFASPTYLKLSGDNAAHVFAAAITAAKGANASGAAVYVYPEEDYAKMQLFLTDNGKGGVAVKPDGDIVSVFNTPGSGNKGMVSSALQLAVQHGGNKLDCFDTVLPKLYGACGFKAIARTRWNDEYAPPDWPKEQFRAFNGGKPDVVFMVYDPGHGAYQPGEGKVLDDYDQGVAMQADATRPRTVRKFNAVGASLGVRNRRYV